MSLITEKMSMGLNFLISIMGITAYNKIYCWIGKGANTLYVRGTDLAGNKGTADMITVTYQEKKAEGKPGIIPGFETIILIAMLGVCAILLRKRKALK